MSSRPHFPVLDRLVAQIDPRNSWVGYLIAAGTLLSIGLALSEPSASEGLGLPARLAFWLAHVSSALFLFELAQIHLGRIALFERLPPLLLVMAVGVVGAFFFAVFNLLLLDPIAFPGGNLADPEPISILGFMEELRDSGAISVLFWVLLNSPRLFIIARQYGVENADEPPPLYGPATSPVMSSTRLSESGPLLDLVSRLPRKLGTDIVAISAELHYLRVYTSKGEALILMSFGRAVKALCVIPGQSIHRSHWVALNHIVALEAGENRVSCRLDTGLALPVSRTYRASLRGALTVRDEKILLKSAQRMAADANSNR